MTRKGKKILWLVMVLAIFGGISLEFYRRHNLWNQVDAAIQALREKGEPVTFQDLYAEARKIPIEDNGGPILQRACLSVTGGAGNNVPFASATALPPFGQPLTEVTRQEIDQWVQANQKALEISFEAGKKKHVRLVAPNNNDWNSPPLVSFVQGRTLAQLLAADMVRRAEQKQRDESFERLMTGLSMAEAFKNDAPMVSYMIGVAIQGLMLEAWEWSMSHVHYSEAQVDLLHARVQSLRDPEKLKRMFQGERTLGLWAFEIARKGKFSSAFRGMNGNITPRRLSEVVQDKSIGIFGQLPRQELDYLKFMDTHIKLSELTNRERHLLFDRELKGWHQKMDQANVLESYRNFILLTITPNLSRALITLDKNDTKLLLAMMALRVDLYRQKQGSLPEQLSELGPGAEATFKDPWVLAKFVLYKKTKGGFRFISVGFDGKEDSAAGGGDDVSFEVVYTGL